MHRCTRDTSGETRMERDGYLQESELDRPICAKVFPVNSPLPPMSGCTPRPARSFEHFDVHEAQLLVIEQALRLEAEQIEVGEDEEAVGPVAGARDSDPATLGPLGEGRHV